MRTNYMSAVVTVTWGVERCSGSSMAGRCFAIGFCPTVAPMSISVHGLVFVAETKRRIRMREQ